MLRVSPRSQSRACSQVWRPEFIAVLAFSALFDVCFSPDRFLLYLVGLWLFLKSLSCLCAFLCCSFNCQAETECVASQTYRC